jgi:3-dehydrosphinganine reductase
MMDLTEKNIYITGGSSGIGLETAKLVYARGANLVLIARDKDKLHLAVKAVEAVRRDQKQRVAAVSLDVSDFNAVSADLPNIVEDNGVPDILIANAGILVGDHFENISYEVFDRVMKINVYGVRNVISLLLPKMKRKGGRIVIVSSMAGLTGIFGYTAYSTSKFALIGFAESLRYEMKRFNIRVSLVCPPEVDTPMIEEEAKTLPPEARAVKNMTGLLSPESAGKAVLKALSGNRFLTIPGLKAGVSYCLLRLVPGCIVRFITDLVIASASESKTSGRS